MPATASLTSLPEGPAIEVDASEPGDPAMIAYTSGTTGRPKGAVLSHANLLAGAQAVVEAWEWTPADRLVLALPLFHMHGLGVGVNGTLLAGASAVVLPAFSPDAVADAVRDHDATMFFGVPTMWARLAGSPRLAELAALRLLVSGSAPVAARSVRGGALGHRAGAARAVRDERDRDAGGEPAARRAAPGNGGAAAAGGRDPVGRRRRGGGARPQRVRRLLAPAGGDRGGVHPRRLVPHRRPRRVGRGGPPAPRRPGQRADHHRRLQRLPARGRGRAAHAPGGRRRRGGRRARPRVGRGRRGVRRGARAVSDEALAAHLADRVAPYKRPRRWYRVDELPRNAMGKVVRADLRET